MADVSEVDTTTLTPTDLSTTLSVTLDSSKSRGSNSKDRLDITRDDLEKCQLLHTIQLLKLQTSQKQLVIDTCHNTQAAQVEELRELLADAQHEKKLLSLRVQSLSHGYEQELKRTRERLEEERARAFTDLDQRDCETAREEVKQELELALSTCSLLDEAQYQNLKSADSAGLPIEDLVRIRLHEITEHLQKQCNNFQVNINHLNQQLKDRGRELALSEENSMQANERVCQQEEECSNLAMELKLVKTQVLEGNYKVNNFDAIKKERDTLRLKVEELQTSLSRVETKDELIHQELKRLTKELSAVQQSEALLHHDKEYLSRQVGDLTQKVSLAEERVGGMHEEVLAAGQSREDMLKQLIKSREEKSKECDRWMEVEMEGLKARTALEIDQLKAQTREMYERENKVLIEVRDNAVIERDRAKAAEKEANDKYESLMKEHHSLQTAYSKHLSELQGELQVTRFEKERTGLVHQETIKGIRHLQLEQEKLQKKVGLLTQELQACESNNELQVKSLETQLQGTQQQLQGYERIEKELDDIVMESAQMEHPCDAERVLFSYGFGTSVPAHSKRRLQQSVQLARRVLHLEKINVSLRDQAKRDKEKISELTEELASGRTLLEGAQQPYTYLVSRIKEQKELHLKSKQRLSQLEEEMEVTKREKAALVEAKNQMAADLERLLNHREEIRLMKAVLLGGTEQRSPPAPDPFSSSRQAPKHTTGPPHLPHPIPTVFTKQ